MILKSLGWSIGEPIRADEVSLVRERKHKWTLKDAVDVN